ncbi:MAG: cytochrome c [Marivita sp.]|uniref:c-type cytochrome n=1 Tax=Marivita sp. TaxID=2003365 RepID=UPI001B254BB1|nr:cytochrome c [Marivita sp.]MBO6885523.1 cytochrome c [Marivita sp.]
MTMRSFRYGLALFLTVLSGAATAQDGNVTMGQQIAEEYCVACHVIDRGGPFKLEPPSFAAIAVYRSAEQIRARIEQPIHAAMPRYTQYMIGGNIDDMVAYITSLGD